METFGGNVGGGVDQKSSRARRGKWKHNSDMSTPPPEPELVIPDGPLSESGEKPRSKYAAKKTAGPRPRNTKPPGVSAKSTQGTRAKNETTPDSVTFTTSEIPQDVLEKALELLREKPEKNWVRTPGPIRTALKLAGFDVKVISFGIPEKPGDMLELSQKHNGNDYTLGRRSTKEVAEILQGIIEQQERGRFLKAMETNNAQQLSETSEPPEQVPETPINPAGEGEPEVGAPQDDAEASGEESVGETMEVNEDGVPILTDVVEEEIVSPEPTEVMSDTVLKKNAERMAKIRAKILRAEEEGVESPEVVGKETPEDMQTPEPENPNNRAEAEPKVEEDPQEPASNEAPPAPRRPHAFNTRFETEFGVTKEMWEKIPRSEKLTPGQQILVCENLKEFLERDKTPYLSKVWEGIREKLPVKKDLGPTLSTLTQLVESVDLYGPKVHEGEDGMIAVDFVGLDLPRGEKRKEWKHVFDSLNVAAHSLCKTPASWQEDGIGTHSEHESKVMSFVKDKFSPSRKRYNKYKEIQKEYEDAKLTLSKLLTKAGFEEDQVVKRLIDIDKNVYMLQFQQTSPDAVEAIKDIPDANMWQTIGRSLYDHRDKFGYAALGFVGRAAVAGVTGVLAAPTVSVAIGGHRAWNKSAAEIRERDRAARMGVRDTSKEALNIVSAEMTMKVGKEKYEVGATQKLQNLIDKYNTLKEKYDIEGPPSPEYIKDMNALLESIRVRASYVEDKQRLNRISFGDREERPAQMAKLYRTLATAQMIVAENRDFPKTKEELPKWRSSPVSLEKKLAEALSKTEDKLQNKRRARQVKDASKGAFIAGVSSYVGTAVATHLQEFGIMGKPSESLTGSSLSENTPPSAQNLVSPEGTGSGTYPFAEDAPMNPNAANFSYAEDAPMSPNAMNFPYAEEAPAMNGVSETLTNSEVGPNAFGSYEIQRGDTLTKILKEQMPEIKGLGRGPAQENALANILRGLTPEEMKEIGIRSGNPNLIYAGDRIDMDALHKIVESRQSVIEGAVSRFGVPADAVTEGAIQPPATAGIPEVAPSGAPVAPEVAPSGASVTLEARVIPTPEAPGVNQFVARYDVASYTSEDLPTRKAILTEARGGVARWIGLYPDANLYEARDAGIVEGHFKNLFGEKTKLVYGMSAENFLNNGSSIAFPDSGRVMYEFKELAKTVAQPPMRIEPKPGEGMESFLERACMAYAQEAKNLPPDNLINKILVYYRIRADWIRTPGT